MSNKSVSAFVVALGLVLAASPVFAKPGRGHARGHYKKKVIVVERRVEAPAPRVVVVAPAPRVVVTPPSVTVTVH